MRAHRSAQPPASTQVHEEIFHAHTHIPPVALHDAGVCSGRNRRLEPAASLAWQNVAALNQSKRPTHAHFSSYLHLAEKSAINDCGATNLSRSSARV